MIFYEGKGKLKKFDGAGDMDAIFVDHECSRDRHDHTIKNREQIEGMRKAGRLLYEVLQTVEAGGQPGVTTRS